MMKRIILIITGLLISCSIYAQQAPAFFNEIQTFKQKDSLSMPAKGGILFVGSSSLRKWKTVEQVYQSYGAINRGFGGAHLDEVIYYADDIIFPYHPRQILIYCGENDIAAGVDPVTVADRFKILFSLIRKKMPAVQVDFISIKPSISREKFLPQFIYANELIKTFIATQQKASYIDVYQPMLADKGYKEIFESDKLHMNDKGYDIWIKAITPYLLKVK